MNDVAVKNASAAVDLTEEIAQLHTEKGWLQNGRMAKTLVKFPDFRAVLTLLGPGKKLEEHKAEGSASIHVLRGTLKLQVAESTLLLTTGQVLMLEPGQVHTAEAMEECAFLVSISWRT